MNMEYKRVTTRFPHIPTDQPSCVEDLHDLQRQQWLDFSKSVIDILDKKNKINIVQIIVISVLVLVIIVMLILIAYFVYRNMKKR